jgi:hypothetical protein
MVWTGKNTTTYVVSPDGDWAYNNVTVSRPPVVTVIYPNDGENISIGSTVTVNASVDDDFGPTGVTGVKFSYSNDSGVTWHDIDQGQYDSGDVWNCTWDTAVLNKGPGGTYKIMANATDNSTVGYAVDTSDDTFWLTDDTKPLLCNETAIPSTIVVNITNTTLCVDVTDKWSNISGDVTVNLTDIGGAGNAIMSATGYNYTKDELYWIRFCLSDVNVTLDQYVGAPCLPVNVSDTYGNYNDSECIQVNVVKGEPPTNLTATWNQTDGTVNISWNGTAGADYDIYITQNYTTEFAGMKNYTVTGLSWIDNNAANYRQRGKFDISIKKGWNLIAIPFMPVNTTLSAIVCSDKAVDSDMVYRWFNPGGYQSTTYGAGQWWSPEVVEPVEPNVGYWYGREGGDFNLTIAGSVLTGEINTSIKTNWNLAGYAGINTTNLTITFGDNPGDSDMVYRWFNPGGYQSTTYGANKWWSPEVVEPVEPGVGYWYGRKGGDFNWIYTP